MKVNEIRELSDIANTVRLEPMRALIARIEVLDDALVAERVLLLKQGE